MSIQNAVDFEINRIHMDEIKVSYFLKFLAKIEGSALEVRGKQKKASFALLVGESLHRSKQALIKKFIN